MAETSPQSPIKSEAPAATLPHLRHTLDDLMEKYLNLLHRYQTLQEALSTNLSSGYLSLAQANFSNPNRIRYGQDFYDDRMRASNLISINPSSNNITLIPARETPSINSSSAPAPQEEISEKIQQDVKVTPRDPLNWFGILVPPTLRKAQGSFKSALDDVVPAMATVVVQMRQIEIEIRRTRKKILKAG